MLVVCVVFIKCYIAGNYLFLIRDFAMDCLSPPLSLKPLLEAFLLVYPRCSMLPRTGDNECYISISHISKRTGIHAYRFQYHAKKMRLRTLKMRGVRMIEVNHAICLLEWFQRVKHIDTQAEVERLTNMERRKPSEET